MSSKNIQFKDIIRLKQSGQELSEEQIQFWIDGVVAKTIPDYQLSVLLMTIYFKGLNVKERSILTRVMAKSGVKLDFSETKGFKSDKHSTGGIGDKTSLILAPVMAAIGYLIPMISGRGLGHTGGTVDKLETIPEYQTTLTVNQMKESISKVGLFICGQSEDLAPADKIIYSLRDVTETVNETSLITSSILSKKFAEGIQGLTLDVKYGTGAFKTNYDEAKDLAKSLVSTANAGGVKCQALITRMDYPLGEWVGNRAEVWECVDAMTPGSVYCKYLENDIVFDPKVPGKLALKNPNLTEIDTRLSLVFITAALAINMLELSGCTNIQEGYEKIKQAWIKGEGLNKFVQMTKQQCGNYDEFIKLCKNFKSELAKDKSDKVYYLRAKEKCKIKSIDGQVIGNMMCELGAGRKVKTDKIDPDITMQYLGKMDQVFNPGDIVLKIYHPDPSIFQKIKIEQWLEKAVKFTTDLHFTEKKPFIYEVITE